MLSIKKLIMSSFLLIIFAPTQANQVLYPDYMHYNDNFGTPDYSFSNSSSASPINWKEKIENSLKGYKVAFKASPYTSLGGATLGAGTGYLSAQFWTDIYKKSANFLKDRPHLVSYAPNINRFMQKFANSTGAQRLLILKAMIKFGLIGTAVATTHSEEIAQLLLNAEYKAQELLKDHPKYFFEILHF